MRQVDITWRRKTFPRFQVEDDMPPEAAMRFRVDFIYSEDGFEENRDKF